MRLFLPFAIAAFSTGCRATPRAIGVGLSPDRLEQATDWMTRLGTWRTRAFKRDVQLELVAPDGSGRDGWYDADRAVLTLVDRDTSYSPDLVLVHELTHALQDQHQDLATAARRVRAPEAEQAWNALVEGEATLASAELVGFDLHGHPTSGGAHAEPDSEATLFTYMVGARYVSALRLEGGWAAVDAAWRNPPTTTDELLQRALGATKPGSPSASSPAAAVPGSSSPPD